MLAIEHAYAACIVVSGVDRVCQAVYSVRLSLLRFRSDISGLWIKPTVLPIGIIVSRSASSTTMRPYPLSHVESPELIATAKMGVERCVTGFPLGFGGWTAAKMYERRISSSNPQQPAAIQTDNAAAIATRQEVCLNHSTLWSINVHKACHFTLLTSESGFDVWQSAVKVGV